MKEQNDVETIVLREKYNYVNPFEDLELLLVYGSVQRACFSTFPLLPVERTPDNRQDRTIINPCPPRGDLPPPRWINIVILPPHGQREYWGINSRKKVALNKGHREASGRPKDEWRGRSKINHYKKKIVKQKVSKLQSIRTCKTKQCFSLLCDEL